MPDEAVNRTGFFGKLPKAGDFVSRGLASGLVRNWDRWVSRHLALPMASEGAEDGHPLRFATTEPGLGPITGIVLPSSDRAGRRFPLTIAAAPPMAGKALDAAYTDWFDQLEEVGRAARQGAFEPDALLAKLDTLPFPEIEARSAPLAGMSLWTRDEEPIRVAPDAPGDVLRRLLKLP